jgi:hypothetical protein
VYVSMINWKNMKVLIDSNVLLDVLTKRDPFYNELERSLTEISKSLISIKLLPRGLADSIEI